MRRGVVAEVSDVVADRVARVNRYWDALAVSDVDTLGTLISDDVFRSGTLDSDVDDLQGKQEFFEYYRPALAQLASYRNLAHDILAAPDGSRAYIHCTEWNGVGDVEFEVHMIIRFDFDADGLMTKIDIFWKSMSDPDAYADMVKFLESLKR
jgi:hypothetical protein